MIKTGISVPIIFCITIALSCCPEKVKDEVNNQPAFVSDMQEHFSGMTVADTIIYDVIIKNPNPDDSWTDKCLKHLNKKQFIDRLFKSVYNGQATAFDLFSGKIMTPDELKSFERKKEFNRNKIGKIQFTESWYYNDSLQSMSKKVISMSLGYEVFDEKGNLIGHKPVFKIYLK
jgi:hypothetical protein